MEPPPKTPSILPTLRPLFSPYAFSLTLSETQKHLKTPSFGRTTPNVRTALQILAFGMIELSRYA